MTIEFDNNQIVEPESNIPVVVNGAQNMRNDFSISASSSYTHHRALHFFFEIDGTAGTRDTFKWSRDGGITFVGEKIPISPRCDSAELVALVSDVAFGSHHRPRSG